MATDPKDQQSNDNDNASANSDNIGENTGDSQLEKGSDPHVQDKPDDVRVKTVTPSNDNGDPGPSTEEASNKNQGPAGENL